MSKLLILLICLGLAFAADFQAEVRTSSGINGTLIQVEDSGKLLQRIQLDTFPVKLILRRFDVTSNQTTQTYSSELTQIGDWNPPSQMCCNHHPISSDQVQNFTLSQIQPGLLVEFNSETLEVISVNRSGVLPELISEALDGFAQVEAVCPLYCPAKMEIQLVMDFSGSISSAEFEKFTHFVQKLTNRILIDPDHVQVGMITFGGYYSSSVPDTFCIPVGEVGDPELFWQGALTNSSWVDQIQWNNHSSVSAGYQCWDIPVYQTNTGGYASLELPVSSDSEQVRTAAARVNNERSQLLGNTAIGTGLRLSRQTYARIPASGSPRIVMVLTDGHNNRGETPNTAADDLRADGITLYSVGVGSVSQSTLVQMAGNESRVFSVDTLSQMDQLLEILISKTCLMAGSNFSTDVCQEVPAPITNQPPTVEITADTGDGIVPTEVLLTVTITDSDGYPTNLTVDWGDEITSENPNGGVFTHLYNVSGTYTIVVVCIDNSGDSGNASVEITLVDNQPPTASLSVTPTFGTSSVEITYLVTASDPDGTVTGTLLDFGDSSSTSNLTGTHVYSAPGIYNLTLTVTDNHGAEVIVTEKVTVNAPPTADLQVSPTTGIAPESVQATVTASDLEGPTTSVLNWGDGTSENVVSGVYSHTYLTNGSFVVSLTVTDSDGVSANDSENVSIAPNSGPTGTVQTQINGTEVVIIVDANDPDGNITDITIDFGDGINITGSTGEEHHTYPGPGTYNITVTITDDKNTSVVIETTVHINALPIVNLSVTPLIGVAPETVYATVTASDAEGPVDIVLDWGDGTVSTVSSGVHQHLYTNGTFLIVVTVTDSDNAMVDASETVTLSVNSAPIGDLIVSENFGTETLNLSIIVSVSDPDGVITDITIDFGDGVVITGSTGDEEHLYTVPGNYTIVVTVTDDKNASLVLTEPVRINAEPEVSLTVTPITGVTPQNVTAVITASDAEGPVEIVLDWGDGTVETISAGEHSHIYTSSGNFTVKVTVTDSDNVEVTEQILISLIANTDPSAVFTLTPRAGLVPLQVIVDPSGSSDAESHLTYFWNWGDGTTSITTEADLSSSRSARAINPFQHEYISPGRYTVTLRVEDAQGAEDSASESLTAIAGSTGGDPTDHDDTFNCTVIGGIEVCASIQVAGVCINRFKEQAAFWVQNLVDWDLNVPVGINNTLLPGTPPATEFPAREKQWFWIPWNDEPISWRVVDPLTGLESVGRVDSSARACYPLENNNLLAALTVEGCGSSTLETLWSFF